MKTNINCVLQLIVDVDNMEFLILEKANFLRNALNINEPINDNGKSKQEITYYCCRSEL